MGPRAPQDVPENTIPVIEEGDAEDQLIIQFVKGVWWFKPHLAISLQHNAIEDVKIKLEHVS